MRRYRFQPDRNVINVTKLPFGKEVYITIKLSSATMKRWWYRICRSEAIAEVMNYSPAVKFSGIAVHAALAFAPSQEMPPDIREGEASSCRQTV
jgi:hypothetical protein